MNEFTPEDAVGIHLFSKIQNWDDQAYKVFFVVLKMKIITYTLVCTWFVPEKGCWHLLTKTL
jgi:hypothetical protein